jgi:hypothetical protein
MRSSFQFIVLATTFLFSAMVAAYEAPVPPYAPAAGEQGSTAIAHNDERILSWATSVQSVTFGEEVADEWKKPDAALGTVDLDGFDVTVLGSGGEIILGFSGPIVDGEGADFAIFENSFSDTFIELAFVEVSTDGIHFVRFPNYSLTPGPIPAFGDIPPTQVHGYAGKYRIGFGVPFDLAELASVDTAIRLGYSQFSESFKDAFVANFPYIDMNDIRYVRLIDIPGDGREMDCEGYAIYDPYKTVITAGFDLDAVAVLNRGLVEAETYDGWCAEHSVEPDPEADTDGDGWKQYLEYYFGTNPGDSGAFPAIAGKMLPDGSYRISYWRRKVAELDPSLKISSDGSDWDTVNIDASSQIMDTKLVSDVLYVLEEATLPVSGNLFLVRFELTATVAP